MATYKTPTQPQTERGCLSIIVKLPFQIGEVRGTSITQVWVYKNKSEEVEVKGSKFHVDIDHIDVEDVSYMNMPTENTYASWTKLVSFHKDLGIDLPNLVNEEVNKILTKEYVLKLTLEHIQKEFYS